jgi:hypothetical protein
VNGQEDGPMCGAILPIGRGLQYICTLDAGHAGQHAAEGTDPLQTWTDSSGLVRGEDL